MLSCKEATQLMSQKMDGKLSAMNRLSLGFHLLMCKGCRNFDEQIHFLRKAAKRIAGNGDDSESNRKDR